MCIICMAHITLSIPDDVYTEMKHHPEIKWSEVARKSISEQAQKLEWMNHVLRNSKFTMKDADIIGHKLKADILKRLEDARNENTH